MAAKVQALASDDSQQANLLATQRKLQQDEALHARTERDRVRYRALVAKHEISCVDYDARETEAIAAAQAEGDPVATTARDQQIEEATFIGYRSLA